MKIVEVKYFFVKYKFGLMCEGDISIKCFCEFVIEVVSLLIYEVIFDFEIEKVMIEGWNGFV